MIVQYRSVSLGLVGTKHSEPMQESGKGLVHLEGIASGYLASRLRLIAALLTFDAVFGIAKDLLAHQSERGSAHVTVDFLWEGEYTPV
jgi:hypothetical protein